MPSDDPTLAMVVVPGKAIPKGSLVSTGKGRMREDNERTGPFREAVREAIHADMAARGMTTSYPGAVGVQIIALFEPPSRESARRRGPVTRAVGDSDKIARTVLDALHDPRREPGTKREIPDSALLVDDSQVVDLQVAERYAPRYGAACGIWVYRVGPYELENSSENYRLGVRSMQETMIQTARYGPERRDR